MKRAHFMREKIHKFACILNFFESKDAIKRNENQCSLGKWLKIQNIHKKLPQVIWKSLGKNEKDIEAIHKGENLNGRYS